MIDEQFEKDQLDRKVRDDMNRVKENFGTLQADATKQFSTNVEDKVGHAAESVSTWVENGVSQLSQGIGKLSSKTKQGVVSAATTAKRDIGTGLINYNTKIQDVANKAPGDIAYKATTYPWVAMSITLLVGFVVGTILKPTRKIVRLDASQLEHQL